MYIGKKEIALWNTFSKDYLAACMNACLKGKIKDLSLEERQKLIVKQMKKKGYILNK